MNLHSRESLAVSSLTSVPYPGGLVVQRPLSWTRGSVHNLAAVTLTACHHFLFPSPSSLLSWVPVTPSQGPSSPEPRSRDLSSSAVCPSAPPSPGLQHPGASCARSLSCDAQAASLQDSLTVCTLSLSHAHALPPPWSWPHGHLRARSCQSRPDEVELLTSAPAPRLPSSEPRTCLPFPIYRLLAIPICGSASQPEPWDPAASG